MMFTGNKQFDFQIQRFTSLYIEDEEVQRDRKEIGSQIVDFNSWKRWWLERASYYEKTGKLNIASSYYKAAMFYLTLEDPDREDIYQSFQRTFYTSFSDFDYERDAVPYQDGYLPTLLLKNPRASKTLLVMGGFDGFLEEIAGFFGKMKDTDYKILIFDGPGQGNTISQGLRFTPNFHEPVAAVLDSFKLDQVDAMGLSWGGFLVMQAASMKKRIRKVIAMDIFYSPMDALKMNLGNILFAILSIMINRRAKYLINPIIKQIANNRIDLIRNLKNHNVGKYLAQVTQDCLLLVGQDDHYVPYHRIADILLGLTNARSIQVEVFTKKSGGEEHCQVGHMNLAFNEIKHFLS